MRSPWIYWLERSTFYMALKPPRDFQEYEWQVLYDTRVKHSWLQPALLTHNKRLKGQVWYHKCHNQILWIFRPNRKAQKKAPNKELKDRTDIKESTIPQNPTLYTPDTDQRLLLTPHSEKHEHSHHPLETLRSMRTTDYTHRNSVCHL